MLMIGNILSGAAALFMAFSSWTDDRRKVFALQALNTMLLAAASFFFQSYSGIAVLLICTVRNLLVSLNRYPMWSMCLVLIITTFAGCAVNNRGLLGLLPVITTVQYTVCSYFIREPQATRISILVNVAIWLVYEILILDISSSVCDTVVLIVTVSAILRHRTGKNNSVKERI